MNTKTLKINIKFFALCACLLTAFCITTNAQHTGLYGEWYLSSCDYSVYDTPDVHTTPKESKSFWLNSYPPQLMDSEITEFLTPISSIVFSEFMVIDSTIQGQSLNKAIEEERNVIIFNIERQWQKDVELGIVLFKDKQANAVNIYFEYIDTGYNENDLRLTYVFPGKSDGETVRVFLIYRNINHVRE